MVYLLVFLAGMVFATIVGVWVTKYYLKLKKRFASPVWYPVVRFNTFPEADGVYLMDFALGNDVCHGYTKKCPPQGVEPKDLKVKIRTISPKRRCLYRVFWVYNS